MGMPLLATKSSQLHTNTHQYMQNWRTLAHPPHYSAKSSKIANWSWASEYQRNQRRVAAQNIRRGYKGDSSKKSNLLVSKTKLNWRIKRWIKAISSDEKRRIPKQKGQKNIRKEDRLYNKKESSWPENQIQRKIYQWISG